MDESSALKFIFRDSFNEKTGIVHFNNKIHSYSEFLQQKKENNTFFGFILQREEEIIENRQEIRPEIDVNMAETTKITEEQFLEWKKNRRIFKKQTKVTGREIWLEQKRRGVSEAVPEQSFQRFLFDSCQLNYLFVKMSVVIGWICTTLFCKDLV